MEDKYKVYEDNDIIITKEGTTIYKKASRKFLKALTENIPSLWDKLDKKREQYQLAIKSRERIQKGKNGN